MKKSIVLIVALAVSLFIFFTIYFFTLATHQKHLPVFDEVAPFTLIDTNTKEFGLNELKGKTWVIGFFFTTCGDDCPMMTKHMAALHRSYRLMDEVALVSVTVNPENDSPKVLSQYAQKYNADTSHWHFLTGSRKAITDLVVKSFKVGSIEEPIFHSTKFVLVDRQGRMRGYYDGTSQKEIEQLFKDMATAVREK